LPAFTNPRIFERSLAIGRTWRQTEELGWTAHRLMCPIPPSPTPEVLAPLIKLAAGRTNPVPDAHLAALALDTA
jgi:hypothetical protein